MEPTFNFGGGAAPNTSYLPGIPASAAFSAFHLLRNCNYLLSPPISEISATMPPMTPCEKSSYLTNFSPIFNCYNPLVPTEPLTRQPPSPQCGSLRRQRGEKKPIPEEQKDDKYFERRRRNNQAAKKSRDARKMREDQIALRATILEHENAILRAQIMTLREETTSLRQMLMVQKKNGEVDSEKFN